MKSSFLAMAMMASMMDDIAYPKQSKGREYLPPEPPKKVIPKGCKGFKFKYGNNEFYECIATSKKSADKKFKSFLKRNVGF
jgi:hypothetical protein